MRIIYVIYKIKYVDEYAISCKECLDRIAEFDEEQGAIDYLSNINITGYFTILKIYVK